jgi:hypothetical protein
MRIVVDLPDQIARQIIPEGQDPARAALEDIAVEAYRACRLTEHQLATLLGLGRYDLDGFLKQRQVWLENSPGEIERELETAERLRQRTSTENSSSVD